MKDFEKVYTDLQGIFKMQLTTFYLQWKNANKDPDELLSDEVEAFLVEKLEEGLEDIRDNKIAIKALVAIFMNMLINNIEEEFCDKEDGQ